MKRLLQLATTTAMILLMTTPAMAHFGMLIPSDSMVMQNDNRTIRITLSFSHPFEGAGMPLVQPKAVGVMIDKKRTDLSGNLKEVRVMGQKAWSIDYPVTRPGAYIFYMEPRPYWEPAEDCFIIHYTKTVVAAFGDDQDWDREIGLKTEIVPLAKPFGQYTGNVFQGIVKLDGKPAAFTDVEVEYYNRDGKAEAPTQYMITQSIRTDANGVFTYAAPRAGWWGFAALSEADFKLKKDGQDKDVEIGAVIWVKFHDWTEK